MKLSININDLVEVKLTNNGKMYLKTLPKHVRDCINHHMFNDVMRVELWDLMNIFGKKMYMGSEQMFENNEIVIET